MYLVRVVQGWAIIRTKRESSYISIFTDALCQFLKCIMSCFTGNWSDK
jgi:hypothetical protein